MFGPSCGARMGRFAVWGALACAVASPGGATSEAEATLGGGREAIVAEMEVLPGLDLSAADRLDRLGDLLLAHTHALYPDLALAAGDVAAAGRWRDESLAAIEREHADLRLALHVARAVERHELPPERRIDLEILLDQLEATVAGFVFPQELLAISQLEGVHLDVPNGMASLPVDTAADLDAVLARLRGVPRLVAQYRERLEAGVERRVVVPRAVLRAVPGEVRAVVPVEPWESPVLSPAAVLPDGIGDELEARFREEAEALYDDEVRPALLAFADYLDTEYLPAAPASFSRSSLPDGTAWYAHLVRRSTTTDLDPEALHAIGRGEVDRIERDMADLADEMGVEGGWRALNERLRSDPSHRFVDEAEMLRHYRDVAKRIDAELPALFRTLPRLPYAVRAMPEFIAASAPAAYYWPGSMAAGKPGRFVLNTTEIASRPRWRAVALTLHEAVPGHHLQDALAQELGDLPWYRKLNPYSAYREGWALYAERLGLEMGFFDDPAEAYGRLAGEQWRALRLVVDTGIHARGWSRDAAIAFLEAHSPRSRHEIEIEVDRYSVWPGQALSYKVGEMEIVRLRREAEARLANRFDIRAFHDVVLATGPVPLDLLRRRVGTWVERQVAASGD